MTTKHTIQKEFTSLNFIKTLNEKFCNLYIVEDFDIDPFTEWSTEFSAEYWYLKYHLLQDGEVEFDATEDGFVNLYKEENLNINWLTLTDKENFNLKCVDGNWKVEILNAKFNRLNEILNL
ncbi:hypothetical protein RF683_03580 [Flavobacterium sp. 20NA77.7]|uniref:Immunity protein 53 n=1 Tax=Flavobacterium nakdongensis TaxID=3073563 RepID=A0ABY9REG4_9FLAO|nr:hypothetical protein [Flavobacterium sp. 20NA77.7]WMW78536.1 hypothetical protein RF683_03580 [Flavobacterium sp. 20NA77.7]